MLITGATGGVGSALLSLLNPGEWQVTGLYRLNHACAEQLAASWQHAANPLRLHACDTSDAEQVDRWLAEVGEDYCPDVAVHLAAEQLEIAPVQRTSWPQIQTQIDAVLKSAVLVTQPLLRRMVRRGSGRIIAALSSVVFGNPPRGFAAYATAKYALMGYLKALAAECAERGVAVNTVSPGPMNTQMMQQLPELLTAQIRASAPSGEWIDTHAVARCIYWLAAAADPTVTGCNIPVTGRPLA